MNRKHLLRIVLLFLGLVVLAGTMVIFTKKTALPESLTPTSTRTAGERLAQPPLPANPSQYEYGRYLYWLNCMACHGDRGQGLTAEFRSLYVEDQNCWARGCHAGRPGDQGFPIPRTVPAVISATSILPPFATPEKLFEFLRATHPPQYPGHLPEDQYWAITNYLLVQNHRLSPDQTLGPGGQASGLQDFRRFADSGVLLLLAVGIFVWLVRRRKSRQAGQKSLQPY